MPRNSQGLYQLPAGNPVVPGTVIEAAWANPTLSDVADALTLSLPRDGSAPMTGPLTLTSGNPTQPRHAASKAFVESFLAYATGLPIGFISPFAGLSGPAGWLKCDGTAVSRTTYASLFALIGTIYGAGDGSTTFNLPDLRNEFIRGLQAPRTVGSKQAGQFAVHSHSVIDPGHAHSFSGNTGYESTDHAHLITVNTTIDGGGAHDHVNGNATYALGAAPAGLGFGGGFAGGLPAIQQDLAGFHNHIAHSTGSASGVTSNHNHAFSGGTGGAGTNISIGSTGSNETVPQNTAFDYYIKAVNDNSSITFLTGIDSNDLQMISIDYTNPVVPVLDIHSNVAFGIPKIDADGKIPLFLLPTGAVVLLGLFDASSNQNPSQKYPATVYHNGEQYIVSVAGTILVYNPATNIAAPTLVGVGTVLTYITGSLINPTGWYFTPAPVVPTQASSIQFLPVGGISATNVQAAIAELDTEKLSIDGSNSMAGNLNFTGVGRRITGDMSNATPTNRVCFQTTTANQPTVLSVLPNGTSVTTALQLYTGSTVNESYSGMLQLSNEGRVFADRIGTGAFNPITFHAGGAERMRIAAAGNVGIGGISSLALLSVFGSVSIASHANMVSNNGLTIGAAAKGSAPSGGQGSLTFQSNDAANRLDATIALITDPIAGNRRLAISCIEQGVAFRPICFQETAAGVVGIGTPLPTYQFHIYGSGQSAVAPDPVNGSRYGAMIIQDSNGVTGNGGALYIGANVGSFAAVKGYLTNGSGNSIGELKFYTRNLTGDNALTERMAMLAPGEVCIGVSAALYDPNTPGRLHVACGGNGTIGQRNTSTAAGKYWKTGPDTNNSYLVFNQAGVGLYVGDGATVWTSLSDERIKDIIEPITNAVSKVGLLRSVIGKFKTEEEGTRHPFIIAQDVLLALPEAVSEREGVLGVGYTEIIPLLVAAINELTGRISQLETN